MAHEALELIQRDRGPDGRPALTVELASRYKQEYYEALKTSLPRGSWFFDYDGTKKWFVLPEYVERAAKLALEHFDKVWLVHGERRTDFRTGESVEQGSFF
jgi:hypothetical protein